MDSDPSSSPPLEQQQQVPDKSHYTIWYAVKHHIGRIGITFLVDIALPLIIYFVLQEYIEPVYALLAASSPPFLMVIFKAILFQTFDALGCLIFLSFIISGLLAVIIHSPIILLLEKSVVSAFVSVILGITLIPFRCCHDKCQLRPLSYYFYQDLIPTTCKDIGLPKSLLIDNHYSENENNGLIENLSDKEESAKVYEWIYTHFPSFRLSCYLVTGIWSLSFLSEFLFRIILILSQLPVSEIFLYGNIMLTIIVIICWILTFICVTKERRQTSILIEKWKSENLNVQ